jgi:citrate lyase subunit beta / citryl-CoA lyase
MSIAHHTALLFVPGGEPKKLEKIPMLEAKSLLLDLEDGVVEPAKSVARGLVADALERFSGERSLWVRVNAMETEHAYADLNAVVRPGLAGINLPKVERPGDLLTLDWLLTQLEREHSMDIGSVRVMATLETVEGVTRADDIAASSSRLECLCFGAADFSRDLGLDWPPPDGALSPVLIAAKTTISLASRRHGLAQPHDGASAEFKNLERLESEALQARHLGFGGKHAIHPAQVSVIERVFRPSPEQLEWARQVLEGFEAAQREGRAAFSLDGRMVDAPVAARARQILQAVTA